MSKQRGFTNKELASAAGKKGHAMGVSHKWTSEEAKAASAKSVAARKARKEAKAAETPGRGNTTSTVIID